MSSTLDASAGAEQLNLSATRGIGLSTYSTAQRNDVISIESMAHDLMDLIKAQQWPNVILCGFSMGGECPSGYACAPRR